MRFGATPSLYKTPSADFAVLYLTNCGFVSHEPVFVQLCSNESVCVHVSLYDSNCGLLDMSYLVYVPKYLPIYLSILSTSIDLATTCSYRIYLSINL